MCEVSRDPATVPPSQVGDHIALSLLCTLSTDLGHTLLDTRTREYRPRELDIFPRSRDRPPSISVMAFRDNDAHFATKALHVGQEAEQWASMAVVPPISTSTTYKQHGPADFKFAEYARR